jgi:hypothetical protein
MILWIDQKARKRHLERAETRNDQALSQHARHTLEERLSLLSPTSHVIQPLTSYEENFGTIYHTLKPGGVFLGAFFGDQTLFELKETFLKVEDKMFGHITPRFLPLFSPSTLIQALQTQGFKDPVLDQERIVRPYQNLKDLYQDLKLMSETNCLSARKKGLTTPRFFEACQAHYQKHFETITFELLYVAAWKG